MRLRIAWAIPWLLAAALSVLLTQGSSAQEDNLLINGGFELGAESWLAIGGELTVSDTLVRSGLSAGVFMADIASSRHELSICVPVAPSAEYTFAGFATRGEDDLVSSLHLTVLWRDREDCWGQVIDLKDSPAVALDEAGHWYEMAISDTSPSAARSASLVVKVEENEATVYLDDFAVSGPPAPVETPTPEPSASPTRTPIPDFTPTTTPDSPTPHASPTASSWDMTPVPTEGTLLNGDFEEADSEGRPAFWQKYGGTLGRTNSVRFQGQFAAAFTSRTGSTKWAYQVVNVQGGKAYALSGYALKDDPAVAAAFLRVSWYASRDGSGPAIDIADSTIYLTDDSPEFRFLTTGAVVAPADATSAKARVMLDPLGDPAGTLYFDSLTFEETALPEPEPTLFPTAAPRPVVDDPPSTPPPRTLATSIATRTPEQQRDEPAPADNITTSPPSPTVSRGSGSNRASAALGVVRTPVASATAAATASRSLPRPLVYRERRSDAPAAAAATASAGNGPSIPLLVLAAGVPALAAAGAGVHYRRWRRARLR